MSTPDAAHRTAHRPPVIRVWMTGGLLLMLPLVATCRLDDLLRPEAMVVQVALRRDTVGVADTIRLSAEATVNGAPARTARLRWSTEDPAILTVDSLTGLARGVARGRVVVRATIANPALIGPPGADSDTVWVVVPRVRLALEQPVLRSIGDSTAALATALDALGRLIPGVVPTVAVEDDPDATVTLTPDGYLIAQKAGRRATVVARSDTAADTAFLVVLQRVDTLFILEETVLLRSLGETRQLTDSAVDARGHWVPNPPTVWTSDDTTVAQAETLGVVRARANGETWMRARAEGGADSVRVVVRQAAAFVDILPAGDTLRALGETDTLRAVVRDAMGSEIVGAALQWESLSPGIARIVSASGDAAVVDAVAEGDAFIEARSTAGAGAGSRAVPIAVRFMLAGLTVSPRDPKLSRLNETVQFAATGRDPNGQPIPNPRVTWSASAPNVLSIDPSTGLATALDSGSAEVKAAHESGAQDVTTASVQPPVLTADVTAFRDSLPLGSTATRSGTRQVGNAGTVTLGARARRAASSAWLTISPDTVTLPASTAMTLTLAAHAAGLAEGNHADTVVLESQGAAGQPKRIPVLFRIFCQPRDVTPDTVHSDAIAAGDCGSRHRGGSLADYYRFAAAAGDTINADMATGAQTDLDTYLFLLDSVGAVVASNDDCPGRGRNSCLRSVTLPVAGRYTVEATTFSPQTLSAYTLGLSRPAAPAAPAALEQRRPDNTPIDPGGSTNNTTVIFRATGTDANARDTLQLEIELRSATTPFTGTPTHGGAPVANAAPSVTLSATATSVPTGEHRWRARVVDQTGRAGPWTAFGPGGPDFAVTVTSPVLTVTPAAVLDSALQGATAVRQQSLDVTNTGTGTFTWSATNSSAWLRVAPASGTTPPDTLTLILDPAGLAAGTHRDTIVVTAGGAVGSPDSIPVTFIIQQPVLVVTPSSFSHATNANSGAAFRDTIRISNAGSGPLAWVATVDAPWVTFDNGKMSGSAPDELALTVTPGTLPAGTHNATLTITATGAGGSPASISITLTLTQPVLAVSASAITDSANVGSTARTRTLDVTNAGGGTMSWSVAKLGGAGWLAATPGGGPAPATVGVTLDPSGLTAGTYAETLRFTSPEALNDPVDVAVQFHVRRPILVVSPAAVADSATRGIATVRTHTLGVTNGNGGVLGWRAFSTRGSGWLSVVPDTAAAPGPITVTLNSTGLPRGTHRDTIVVRSAGAAGSPDSLPVRFDIFESPNAPSGLGQFKSDGTTPVGTGGVTDEATLTAKGTLTDFDVGDQLVLEVEVRPIGTGFSNVSTNASAAVGSGGVASVTLGPFADNSSHHWQARACDQTGRCSGWVSYGANAESAPDFSANPVAQMPASPANLKQYRADGSTQIPVGGDAGSSPATVVLEGLVTDPDPGDLISLEVEIEETSVAFDGSTSVPRGGGVSTNELARVTVSRTGALLLGTNYFWRTRACDQTNRCSAWVSFGGNSDTVGVLNPADTDFRVSP